MAKKPKGVPTKLEVFAKWNRRAFVDKMLDDGESPNKVAAWINENGFEISVPTVYSYARKRKEAIVRGLEIEKAMGRQGIHVEVKAQKRGRKPTPKPERKDKKRRAEAAMSVEDGYRVKSDIELLDAVIQRGFEAALGAEEIKPETAMKAIELKNKLTGGSHNGLTVYGLEEIRLREAARENAILTILLEYVPEALRDEVLEKIDEATRAYYESLGMGDAYSALEEAGDESEPEEGEEIG